MGVVVNLEGAERKTRAAFDRIHSLVQEDLKAVNQVILDNLQSRAPLIPQLANHLIASGGKRLRPMLTLASAKLCGYEGLRHVGLAASVEFIHTATLLHDDVVDESDLRRGEASANALWGNESSVLVGDFLFARAFRLMVADGSLRVLAILSEAASTIAEGEVLQLSTANDPETSEASYLEVVQAKTAMLFAAACEVGAVLAERPQTEAEALRSYGLNLGTAFQLVDDVLDYSAHEQTLGKTIGDDFREGKITLPVVLAYRRGNAEERRFWQRTVEDLDQEAGDLERAIAIMRARDALGDSIKRARHYGAVARDALGIFPERPEKEALAGLIDFCIDRAY
ncbi:MAG: polyprenyl synthetase family protein [Alphaproteobacteria bacterium]|nr:polyprenyl synthetase family protein [Alphaproteobacteria bacterium]